MEAGRPRAAELADLEAESHWDKGRLCPRIAPSSTEEYDAIARIDELRDEDLARQGSTFESRRKRACHYWGRAGRART